MGLFCGEAARRMGNIAQKAALSGWVLVGNWPVARSSPALPVSSPGALRKTQSSCPGNSQLPGVTSYPHIQQALHPQLFFLRSGSAHVLRAHLLSRAPRCPLSFLLTHGLLPDSAETCPIPPTFPKNSPDPGSPLPLVVFPSAKSSAVHVPPVPCPLSLLSRSGLTPRTSSC